MVDLFKYTRLIDYFKIYFLNIKFQLIRDVQVE